ncbi:MAG: Fimbrial assembly family protein [Thermoanaerobacterales bacterium 50_218]|nr:MAG: Fimbrial assembly family protein [Thermoanaerobacterales bacterium 50_218]HAA89358.1 hypothetical protein [Peptococcaceae bacterium]
MYKVNLLPPKLQREGIIDVRRLLLVAGVTVAVVSLLGAYGIFLGSFFALKEELAATKEQLRVLEPTVARAKKVINERKNLESALNEYTSIMEKKRSYYDLLFDLAMVTPVDLWLTDLEVGTQSSDESSKSSDKSTGKSDKASGKTTSEESAGSSSQGPNTVSFKGFSRTLASIGVYMSKLYDSGHFEEIKLKKAVEEEAGIKFELVARLKEVT